MRILSIATGLPENANPEAATQEPSNDDLANDQPLLNRRTSESDPQIRMSKRAHIQDVMADPLVPGCRL